MRTKDVRWKPKSYFPQWSLWFIKRLWYSSSTSKQHRILLCDQYWLPKWTFGEMLWYFAKLFRNVFNCVILNCQFPEIWKSSFIKPIHKKLNKITGTSSAGTRSPVAVQLLWSIRSLWYSKSYSSTFLLNFSRIKFIGGSMFSSLRNLRFASS